MTDETIIAEDDSTINDTDLNDDLDNGYTSRPEPKTDGQSNVAKILAQRNEARKEKNELKKKLESLGTVESRLKEMEELIAKQALEQDDKQKQNEFYTSNPEAKEFESGIKEIKDRYPDMDLNDAYDLYLAKNSPDKLASEGLKNKQDAKKQNITGVTADPLEKDKNFTEMDADEFLKWRKTLGK